MLDGNSERATLEGVQDDNEYQISLSALYGDGAQSEAVAIRYSTSESKSICYVHVRDYYYIVTFVRSYFFLTCMYSSLFRLLTVVK